MAPTPVTNKPLFFATQAKLEQWLAKNHDTVDELWIGYWKKATGKPSVTWPETVDALLCWGWIDGIRKSLSDEAFIQRITPRRKTSNWSAINLKRVEELTKAGRMQPSGLAIHAARDPRKEQQYLYERATGDAFGAAERKLFKANKKAWAYWETCPPGYKKLNTLYVMTAKKPETREKRLLGLIALCAAGKRNR